MINLAVLARGRQSVQEPWVPRGTKETGTLNLLELCRESGVEKFVLAPTSSLDGASNARRFREDANTDGPLSPSAASKKAAEALCYTYHYLYGMGVAVLRYFTVYGPAGRPDMRLFRFVQWISEGGRRSCMVVGSSPGISLTWTTSLAAPSPPCTTCRPQTADGRHQGNWRSEAGGPVFEIINLGSDRPVMLMDAIRLVEELAGKKANIEYKPRHPADVLATWADISKAEWLLGWRPQMSFEDGVRQLVTWYQENQEWAKDVATW